MKSIFLFSRFFNLLLTCLVCNATLLVAQINYTYIPTSGCPPLNVTFTNTSITKSDSVFVFHKFKILYHIQSSLGGFYDLLSDNTVSASANDSLKDICNTDSAGAPFTGGWISKNGTMFVKARNSFDYLSSDVAYAKSEYMAGTPSSSVIIPNSYDVYIVRIRNREQYMVLRINIIDPDDNTCSCPNSGSLFFNYRKTGELQVSKYVWDFDDGSPEFEGFNATHTYTTSGFFYPMLKGYDSTGNKFEGVGYAVEVYDNNSNNSIYSADSACPQELVNFSIYSSNVQSYTWDFGDGSTSNSSNPAHAFTTPGTYNIKLILSYKCGIIDTLQKTLKITNNIYPQKPYISVNPDSACPGERVSIYSYGNNYANYLWDYNDGTTSNTINGDHVFINIGNYNVILTVTNGCGLSNSDSVEIKISNNIIPPAPTIYSSTNLACPGDKINFEYYRNSTDKFLLDFGDGSTSDKGYISHSYSNIGTYTVTLKVTNSCGLSNSSSKTIQITNDSPITNMSFSNYDKAKGCPGGEMSFTLINGLSSYTYFWDFGDGTTKYGDSYESHAFANTGTFFVSVKVTNNCGISTILNKSIEIRNDLRIDYNYLNIYLRELSCPNDRNTFFINADGFKNYLWDFGDGQTSSYDGPNSYNVYHSYSTIGTYNVSLKISNYCGIDTTLYDQIVVENGIRFTDDAYFNLNNDSACPGDTLFFRGDNNFTNHFWNFGDGTTSTLENPKHSYNVSGSYNVTYKITNGCGFDTSSMKTVSISNSVLPEIGNDVGIIEDGAICPGDTILFYNAGYYKNIKWNTGDGNTITNFSSLLIENGVERINFGKYAYPNPGTYFPNAIVTNSCNLSDSANFELNITNDNSPALSQIYFSSSTGYEEVVASIPVNFICIGTGKIIQWDFGDGQTGSGIFISHTYTNPGSYTVKLTVINGCGNTALSSENITIKASSGIEEYNLAYSVNVKILPNPVSGNNFILEVSDVPNNSYDFELFDVLGRKIFQTKIRFSKSYISLGQINNGIYFYWLRNNKNTFANGKILVGM